jgi:hypothetical protein
MSNLNRGQGYQKVLLPQSAICWNFRAGAIRVSIRAPAGPELVFCPAIMKVLVYRQAALERQQSQTSPDLAKLQSREKSGRAAQQKSPCACKTKSGDSDYDQPLSNHDQRHRLHRRPDLFHSNGGGGKDLIRCDPDAHRRDNQTITETWK